MLAGTSHLTWARTEFQAQVPHWVPLPIDLVVILSGIVEILLGLSLVLLARQRVLVGWVVATFFVLVFPGNIAQYLNHADGFGLDTDLARGPPIISARTGVVGVVVYRGLGRVAAQSIKRKLDALYHQHPVLPQFVPLVRH